MKCRIAVISDIHYCCTPPILAARKGQWGAVLLRRTVELYGERHLETAGARERARFSRIEATRTNPAVARESDQKEFQKLSPFLRRFRAAFWRRGACLGLRMVSRGHKIAQKTAL